MKSVMSHNFSQVPSANIPRSQFNRSHGCKTTFNAGYLVPVYVDEALPGDTFNARMASFVRMTTPLRPVMDNIFLDTFFFAVPIRLIWDNWQKFNGEQKNPSDSTDFLVPTMTAPTGGYANESLSDYFGIPTKIEGLEHDSLFHRAYNLIYNEWFRDQNLQDSAVVDLDDGPDNPVDYVLRRRGKRHDYFTSSLPWPQKGPAVTMSLAGLAPVLGIGVNTTLGHNTSSKNVWETAQGSTSIYADWTDFGTQSSGYETYIHRDPDGHPLVFANLSSVSAFTINQLREAFQIQKLYERDARGGTRYIEILRAHFGVISPDARLQRPEYLGGGSTPFNINPIAQTSASDDVTPQGNLAAMATASATGHGFVKSFVEHSVIIGLVNVRVDLNYQQGLNRMFSRQTRWDFYWPALSSIGEQAVLNKEIYAQNDMHDNEVFGYQERYAEYRYKPSIITGKFRSNDAQSLDSWHLAQDFESLPALNSSFIQDNPPMSRILAVTDEPQFLFDSYISLKCARPMPVYSVPGLIDHF